MCISSWSDKLGERSALSAYLGFSILFIEVTLRSSNARGARQHAYTQEISGRERELENEFALIWLKSKSCASLMPLDGIVVCFRYFCSVLSLILHIPFNARHFPISGRCISFRLGFKLDATGFWSVSINDEIGRIYALELTTLTVQFHQSFTGERLSTKIVGVFPFFSF